MATSTRTQLAPPSVGALAPDHPGAGDPAYAARRARIAAIGARHRPGDPVPDVAYTAAEDEVWRTVSGELAALHERLACAEVRRGAGALDLPAHRVPQLREVDERVRACTGFRVEPVAGLVPAREFYGALAERRFRSTQYIRHHSTPRYTPEPDIIHEIIGHANLLASPAFAELHHLAGMASRRAVSDEAHEFFSRVFWFTLEFGVALEDGAPRAYGAGLLSSFGELAAFGDAELRPFSIAAMGTLDYDISVYQPVLFVAESFERMVLDLGDFFRTFDDAAHAAWLAVAGRRRAVPAAETDGYPSGIAARTQ
ncbi:MAG: phenylalanine 4-monooxygenase [Acidimicrobiales bacterium]